MNSIVIAGMPRSAPGGLQVFGLTDPGIERFDGPRRHVDDIDQIVLHETVTRSRADAVRVLRKRKLGVHFIVDADGAVFQHADLADQVSHARGHNQRSIGIEIVNPYYPRYLRNGDPWSGTIDARWADGGRYVLPTLLQAEAVAQLVGWLTGDEGMSIPRRWIGKKAGRMRLGAVPSAKGSGICAHQHLGTKADGSWPCLFAWFRLETDRDPEAAFDECVTRTRGTRTWADISDYDAAARAAREAT